MLLKQNAQLVVKDILLQAAWENLLFPFWSLDKTASIAIAQDMSSKIHGTPKPLNDKHNQK